MDSATFELKPDRITNYAKIGLLITKVPAQRWSVHVCPDFVGKI